MKKSKAKSKGVSVIPVAVFLAIVALLLGVYIISKGDTSILLSLIGVKQTEEAVDVVKATPTVRPTPRPLPKGPQTYTISHGSEVKGPRMSDVTMDPFDPKVGEKQTATVKIKYTSPVTSVTARLDSDNKKQTYTFNRIDGTDTDGTWQATWVTEDTHDYTYYINFKLDSAVDSYTGGLTFR
jgi:hypothetical protein